MVPEPQLIDIKKKGKTDFSSLEDEESVHALSASRVHPTITADTIQYKAISMASMQN
jgi:hypothetical protein